MRKVINLLATITVASIGGLLFASTTSAVTPPDSCFEFNAATGVISRYYDRENNNSSSPVCPKDVDIPASINGAAVTSIGNNAFSGKQLTSVTIPNSVSSIGISVFSFNQLTSVTIPNSVTSIGDATFQNNQLTSVAIPNSVTSIGAGAFSSNQLTSVTIPNSVTSIGDYAFQTNQLTSVVIPNSVISIGDATFQTNQLTSVTIPNSVTNISNRAFSFNQLTSVTIPNSVTSINIDAFSNNQLTSVTIPDSVTVIDSGAFSFNQLTSVTIPNSVTSIDTYAFATQNPSGRDFDYSSAAYDTVWYARLYTEDPANPNNLQDSVIIRTICSDDGSCVGRAGSGHLINPAPTSITYKNQAGDTLRPNETITGKKDNGDVIPDYLVKNGPSIPMPEVVYNPTPAEQQAMRDALQAYYRLGQEQTFTAPTISGYDTITPNSPYTMTLANRDNSVDFVYSGPTTPPPTNPTDPTTPADPTNPNVPGAPDTGVGQTGLPVGILIATGLATLTGAGLVGYYVLRRFRQTL